MKGHTVSNLEIIRQHYAASDRGDLDGMLSVLAPGARWTEMAGFPCAGTYVGADAVRAGVFERLAAEWDDYTADINEVLDAGDTIIGIGEYSGRNKRTGTSFRARVTHVWRLEDGTVTAFEQFTDTLLVARATGEF